MNPMNAELLDLLHQDIYTDAPEYADRVKRIRELLPPGEKKYRLAKGAPKGVGPTRWYWVPNVGNPKHDITMLLEGRWQFQDRLAVLGKAYASEMPEHAGEWYWTAKPWCSGSNGETNGYAATEPEALRAVEDAVMEAL